MVLAALFAPAVAAQDPPSPEGVAVPEQDPPSPEGVAVPAQEPPPFGYRNLEVFEQSLLGMGARELTRSAGGRPVWLATFGAAPANGRPAVLIVANLEGDRLVASEVALRLCQHFAAGSALTDVATVHVVPVANPDAMARALAGKAARRGAAIDEDRDGRNDEDGADDLDGDGHILQLRYPDPLGALVSDPVDARLMQEADPEKGEGGAWTVEAEGRDDDGDGLQAEDDLGGVTLEANFSHRWRAHERDAGSFQLSESIPRALADLVLNNGRLSLVVVLGAEDNLADPPGGVENPDHESTSPWPEDAQLLKLLGDRLYEGDQARPRGSDHRSGNFADWVYFQAGLPVIESALWAPPLDVEAEGEASSDEAEHEASDEAKMLRWADQALTRSFVDWHALESGPADDVADGREGVQIGGWLPLVRTNPPASELDPLGEQWSQFLDSVAGDFAQLSVPELKMTPLGGGVYELEATVANFGLMATMSRMGQATRRHLPPQVYVELPDGGEILSGARVQALGRLHGRGGMQELRWLLRLPADDHANLRILSRNAGELLLPLID